MDVGSPDFKLWTVASFLKLTLFDFSTFVRRSFSSLWMTFHCSRQRVWRWKMCQTDNWDLPDNNNILFQISSWCNKKVWLEGSRTEFFLLCSLVGWCTNFHERGKSGIEIKPHFDTKVCIWGRKKHTCVLFILDTFSDKSGENGSIDCICSENLIFLLSSIMSAFQLISIFFI